MTKLGFPFPRRNKAKAEYPLQKQQISERERAPFPFPSSSDSPLATFSSISGVFPMFVPSLSWQNDRFYIYMAQKWRFFFNFWMCIPSLSFGNDPHELIE
jgi:hypothetical protein